MSFNNFPLAQGQVDPMIDFDERMIQQMVREAQAGNTLTQTNVPAVGNMPQNIPQQFGLTSPQTFTPGLQYFAMNGPQSLTCTPQPMLQQTPQAFGQGFQYQDPAFSQAMALNQRFPQNMVSAVPQQSLQTFYQGMAQNLPSDFPQTAAVGQSFAQNTTPGFIQSVPQTSAFDQNVFQGLGPEFPLAMALGQNFTQSLVPAISRAVPQRVFQQPISHGFGHNTRTNPKELTEEELKQARESLEMRIKEAQARNGEGLNIEQCNQRFGGDLLLQHEEVELRNAKRKRERRDQRNAQKAKQTATARIAGRATATEAVTVSEHAPGMDTAMETCTGPSPGSTVVILDTPSDKTVVVSDSDDSPRLSDTTPPTSFNSSPSGEENGPTVEERLLDLLPAAIAADDAAHDIVHNVVPGMGLHGGVPHNDHLATIAAPATAPEAAQKTVPSAPHSPVPETDQGELPEPDWEGLIDFRLCEGVLGDRSFEDANRAWQS